MAHQIRLATQHDYPELTDIRESAVKAFHHFLSEEDFNYFKKVIPKDYLPYLEVYLIAENKEIRGFAAAAEENPKMLFIHNEARRKGFGKILYQFMKEKSKLSTVDVTNKIHRPLDFTRKWALIP